MTHIPTAELRNQLFMNAEGFLRQNVVHYPLRDGYPNDEHTQVFQRRCVVTADRLARNSTDQGVPIRCTVKSRSTGLRKIAGYFKDSKKWIDADAVIDVSPSFYINISELGKSIRTETCSYFLPWIKEGITEVHLRHDAGLFFNSLMTGCSFGWRVESDGTVKAVHSNLIKQLNTTQQDVQNQIIQRLPMCRVLMADDYRAYGDGAVCSIVGVLINRTWNLYAQTYTKEDGNDPAFKGIETIYRILNVRRL
ncbi:hypothetical protein [Azospirillum argentinense]